MPHDGRKILPHDPPLSINFTRSLIFLTICSQNRTSKPLLSNPTALLDSIRFEHMRGGWFVRLAVIMPDHVHLLVRFSQQAQWKNVVLNWKRWTARNLQIDWQRDFFDHRLRDDENIKEKADYIMANPVRAGLVAEPEDWPYLWINRER